ncbi:hypothetical protein Tco_1214645 [Tanacetum coccineum]
MKSERHFRVPNKHLEMTGADEGTSIIPGALDIPILDQSTTEYYEEEEERFDDEETMNDDEDDEVTKELYKDVNVNLGNEDTEMTNVDQGASEQQNVSQESGFEKEEEDTHMTLTPVLDTQKSDKHVQSSSVSSDFISKLLNLENPSPADNEIASLMETLAHTIPPPPPFNDRVTNLEKDLSEIKQEAQDEKNVYIELIDTSMRALIKEEKNVTESVEAAVLTRASSQLTSTYEAAALLSEFELTKILIDKMDYKDTDKADYKKKLYDALVESYNTDKDLFDSYGEEVTKADWFKKPEQPPTPDPDWSKRQQVNFRHPQTWISQVARAKEPPTSFDELNDTSFDFSAFIMNRLKIPNLTQEILVGPGGDLSRRNSTSVTKTKATTYELKWIKDLVPELWSPVHNMTSSKDVYSRRRIIAVIRLKIMKMYNDGHLEEIEVRQDDQKLYTFKE